MTFGEAKNRVLKLLDEYSSGGTATTDADINNKMAAFFDMAQKQLAGIKRIVKTHTVPRVSGTTAYDMPADYGATCRVWRDDAVTGRYRWRGGQIIIPDADDAQSVVIEYFAVPADITADTTDDAELELAEDAAQCAVYWVATQQLVVDLVIDYGPLLQLYSAAMAALDTSLPGSGGSGGGVRQTLWR